MHAVRGCWMAVGAAVALLALGRPTAADVPPDEAPLAQTTESANLVGTVWEGVDCPEKFHFTYRFEKDGVLVYTYENGVNCKGKWKQDGNKIYFEMNGKYRECQGTVRGNRFEGDSWNVAGAKWQTTLRQSKSR